LCNSNSTDTNQYGYSNAHGDGDVRHRRHAHSDEHWCIGDLHVDADCDQHRLGEHAAPADADCYSDSNTGADRDTNINAKPDMILLT
jgi:hypothetical protein